MIGRALLIAGVGLTAFAGECTPVSGDRIFGRDLKSAGLAGGQFRAERLSSRYRGFRGHRNHNCRRLLSGAVESDMTAAGARPFGQAFTYRR
jgi:hypothetical protein